VVPQDPVLNAKALQKVLDAEALPTLKLLPVTATSHPFNGAAWQNKPIDLAKHGYVEEEYLISGISNLYDWVAGSDFATRVVASGPYTTRIMVRRPANTKTWSGCVVVEMMNASAGYDCTAIWSALWQSILRGRDVYVGITAKAAVFSALQAFDAKRYAQLAMANPLPLAARQGTTPGAAGYDPNFSTAYENGLTWDIATQVGRLLKSFSRHNPLGAPAGLVVLAGESQQANWLVTYYKWFTPAAYLKSGEPVFNGYLADCFTSADPQTPYYPGTSSIDLPMHITWPINQEAPLSNPLPADDPQLGWVPARPVPWISLSSGWEYAAARGFGEPGDDDCDSHSAIFWQLAGANHSWSWQNLYGDADKADLLKADCLDPTPWEWFTTPDNPEVPLHMAEKAAYADLLQWITEDTRPPEPPMLESIPNDPSIGFGIFRDSTVKDAYGNPEGGLRLPMIAVPVCSYGGGRYVLTPPSGLAEIVPFTAHQLAELYASKDEYVARYRAAAMKLVKERYLLLSDALELIAQAKEVSDFSSVRATGDACEANQ
jgi:hypothetical protein